MTELLTAAQMRAIEQVAIDSGEVTGLELMERAGKGVVETIMEEWPSMAFPSHKAVVLCGPGNNGGDGFVIARLLKERDWDVEVFLYGDEGKLPDDAKTNCERWRGMGEVFQLNSDIQVLPKDFDIELPTIFVDAILGTGQNRPIEYWLSALSSHLVLVTGVAPKWHLVAVDIPTGVNTDDGIDLGDFPFYAELTVTFHSRKPVHQMSKAYGKVVVKDIGLSKWANTRIQEH